MISLRLMWKIGVKTEPITAVLIVNTENLHNWYKEQQQYSQFSCRFTLLKATEKQTEKKPEVD